MTSMHNSPVIKRPFYFGVSIVTFFALFFLFPASAEEKSDAEEKQEEKDESKDDDEKVKGIDEVLKDCDSKDGLFPIHQNRKSGKIFLEVNSNQIGKEFIHFSHTLDGVPELGHFRGAFGNERIFTIQRHFEKIEFVAVNTSFYFNPDSALSRASAANVSDAVLASQKVEATNPEKTRFLIEAEGLFLKEFFRQLKPGKSDDDKKDEFKLGDLSDDRTRFLEAKSFPDNTLFRVQYVFENLHPAKSGDADVADSRFVTLKVQHTLIQMPENDYEPRFDDPRVGYFTTQVTDLTSKSSAPYRDLISRWNLKKQNPEAEKSPPVEPITWWIENTTPLELRDTIKNAALAWNKAFESAGFENAIEVKVQPDDAEWDSDDIRYHVLRWTSSPNPPFGGYGPSFVNPRTGQILGADIMLEYVFITNRIRYRDLVKLGASNPIAHFPGIAGKRGHFCQFGDCLHMDRISGTAILGALRGKRLDNGSVEVEELIRQALTDLILHEVGHTLGLNHNFRSSHLYDRKQIHDKELTSKTGVTGSVMDYAPINLSPDPEKQGHYYSIVPGPYDHWAIRFGYADEDELEDILTESTKPEHAFGNDADDMRSAGRGIDPRVMINDLTNEPVEQAVDQIDLVQKTYPKLIDQFPIDGESYQEVRTAFSTLIRTHSRSAETISRFIGGVFIDRSFHGQDGGTETPFQPVPEQVQKNAMSALAKNVFGPDAFSFSPELIAHLQMQRRGFDFFDLDANEDPKIHDSVLDIQKEVLDQILHKNTLARILDTSLYGNTYTLTEVMTDIDSAIMAGDPDDTANSFRAALQIEYIERLIKISGLKEDSKYPSAAQSMAVSLLEKHANDEIPPLSPISHKRHLVRLIDNALNP